MFPPPEELQGGLRPPRRRRAAAGLWLAGLRRDGADGRTGGWGGKQKIHKQLLTAPSTVKMGAITGGLVGLSIGFIFGTYSIFKQGPGPNGIVRSLGQYMLGSAATFGYSSPQSPSPSPSPSPAGEEEEADAVGQILHEHWICDPH
jgi:hypothetical protein